MVKVGDFKPEAAGIPWVREKDYGAFLAISEDAAKLPGTWEEFIGYSKQTEDYFQQQGIRAVRAYIDPATFPAWCKAEGHGVNSKGRMAFAAFIATKKDGTDQ